MPLDPNNHVKSLARSGYCTPEMVTKNLTNHVESHGTLQPKPCCVNSNLMLQGFFKYA